MSLDPQVVIDTCLNRLGKLKRPTAVYFRDEPFPRTPVGKIRRSDVRDQFWGNGSSMGAS